MHSEGSIKINCGTAKLLDDGIIHLRYTPDYEIDFVDVQELEKVFVELAEGKPMYCLLNTSGQYNNFTQEAQKYLSKEAPIVKSGQMKANAVVIDNLPYRLLAKFFLKFFQPDFDMKIFSKEEEARNWLLKLMEVRKDKIA